MIEFKKLRKSVKRNFNSDKMTVEYIKINGIDPQDMRKLSEMLKQLFELAK